MCVKLSKSAEKEWAMLVKLYRSAEKSLLFQSIEWAMFSLAGQTLRGEGLARETRELNRVAGI